jgi:hypothetical protein
MGTYPPEQCRAAIAFAMNEAFAPTLQATMVGVGERGRRVCVWVRERECVCMAVSRRRIDRCVVVAIVLATGGD